MPRPLENGAYVESYGAYERDSLRSTTRRDWSDSFLREKLTLYSNGYSYHPRFVRYRFSIAGAAKQENYDSSLDSGSNWTFGSGFEYDTKLLFLPEHPYNLQVFARRYEPLYKEQASTHHGSVGETYGASFRYREKPYFFHAGYVDDAVESFASSSDVMRVNVDGEYFYRFTNGNELSFNGAFNPSWFHNSAGLDGSSEQYLLGNFINLRDVRLTSSFSKNLYNQDSSTQTYDTEQLAVYELLTAYFPYNFRSDLTYRYFDNLSTVRGSGLETDRRLSDVDHDVQLNVIHRLFESLDSTYTFRRDERSSDFGDTTNLSNGLSLNYTKRIPRGRLLTGASLSRADTDNQGQANVVNEEHSALQVPSSFVLRQQNPDASTILIFLESPLPPFETILLEENVHYVVVPTTSTYEIRVFSLPPEFVVPGTYNFLATYSLATGSFELRSDTVGANVSVQLFENLLTPYFSYAAIRSDVRSGTFPGSPVDSTTYTAGVAVYSAPWRVRGEYQVVEWEANPYESWTAELQFVGSLDSKTTAYATATYLNRHYSAGTSAYYATGFTEESISGAASIQREMFTRSLHLAAGGAYTHLTGRSDTDAYSANSSLTWTLGRLDLSAGATAYASDTSGGSTISTRRDHQLFYLKLRRRLF